MKTEAGGLRGPNALAVTGIRRHAVPLLGLAAVTVAFLWPAVRHFRTRMLAATGDANLFIWAWWHVPRALLEGRNPFRTNDLFFPVGLDLGFHTFAPATLIVIWPVSRLLGWGAAVNLDQLSAAFGAAVAMYFLTLRVAGDRRAAFVAGVAFAFLPYRFIHLGGHFNLIHTWTIPLGVLAFLRLREQPSAGRAVAFGAVVGVTFLTEVQYAVFLLVAVAVLAWRLPKAEARMDVRSLAIAGGTALVAASPLAVFMVAAVLGGELNPVRGWGGADIYSADLVSWVVPPATHPIWGGAVESWRAELWGGTEGLAYPGLMVIALAVAGRELVSANRRRGWVALSGVAVVLSLGPFLHLFGRETALPLPFALVHYVPLLNGLRVPGRFVVVAAMALGVLMAQTLAALMRRRRRGPHWPWAWMVALAVILLEFLPGSLPQRPVRVAQPYHAIAASDDPRAVLEIPMQWSLGGGLIGDNDRENSQLVYPATVHERPLVSGTTSRYPADRLQRLREIPVYRQLLALENEPGFTDAPSFTADDLCRLGIGFVVYHRDRPVEPVQAYVESLRLPVLADDGTVRVWHVPTC